MYRKYFLYINGVLGVRWGGEDGHKVRVRVSHRISTSPAIYSSYQSYWSSALGLSDLKIWIEMETKLEREKKERETENWKS